MDNLTDLLWPSERKQLKTRRKIIQQLQAGNTVRQIAKQLKVSTATVQRTKKFMDKSQPKPHPFVSPYIFGQSQ
jgi:Trp operon repressor